MKQCIKSLNYLEIKTQRPWNADKAIKIWDIYESEMKTDRRINLREEIILSLLCLSILNASLVNIAIFLIVDKLNIKIIHSIKRYNF